VRGSQITEDRVPIRHTSAKWAGTEGAPALTEASTAQNAALERLSKGVTAELEVVEGRWRSLICRVLHQARSTFVTWMP
jgi:hypothetical protein